MIAISIKSEKEEGKFKMYGLVLDPSPNNQYLTICIESEGVRKAKAPSIHFAHRQMSFVSVQNG